MEGEAMHVDFARLQQLHDEELGLVLEDISLGKQRCLAALATVTAKTGSASTKAEAPSKPAEFQAAPKQMSSVRNKLFGGFARFQPPHRRAEAGMAEAFFFGG
jgi:hypothetical protein